MQVSSAANRVSASRSLCTILVGAIAVLSVLQIFAFGRSSLESWQQYRQTQTTQAFDRAANQFIAGLFEVLLERLATNNALQAAEPASAATKQAIEARRKAVHEKYESGLAMLRAQNFANRDALLSALDAALAKANDARAEADRALALPRDKRPEALLKSFVPTLTASVNASLNLWYATLYAAAANDPVLAKLASTKEIGWRMREVSGFERANVAGAIASGTAIPADKLTFNAGTRAQVDVLWAMLKNLMADTATDPRIRKAAASAEELYFKAFRKLADDMKKAGEDGKYPVAATDYVATTNPQIDSLLAVMHAAADVSEARTADVQAEAFRSMMISLIVLAVSIGLAVATILVVLGRVTGPVMSLSATMRRLADGDTDAAVPYLGRRDEMGLMAGSVEVFRKAAVQMEVMRTEQLRAAERADAEKKASMTALADSFEASVKGVVQGVSAAATQMQASANSMTRSTDETNQQSSVVAAAASQASLNVQTVAAAAEQLSASIADIGRQVTQSARVAERAAEEAGKTDQLGSGARRYRAEDRRRGQADQRDRGADQPLGAQCHDRGGPRGRARQGICRRRLRGEIAGVADREGDRRDRRPGRRHSGLDGRCGDGHQADRRHDRGGQHDRRLGRDRDRAAGRRHRRDRPQRPAGRFGHGRGVIEHRRRHRRRGRNRPGIEGRAVGSRRPVRAGRHAPARGRPLPRIGPRGLSHGAAGAAVALHTNGRPQLRG
jgi:methyl-accepting chemotaxis protein